MLARRRVPVFGLDVGDQGVREVFGIVAGERVLAARASECEVVHMTSVRRNPTGEPVALTRR